MPLQDASPAADSISQAWRIGGWSALAVALGTGGVLIGLARGKLELAVSVASVTTGVAIFAFWVGRLAGVQIRRRGWLAALGIGAIGGLASLLVAAAQAALAGVVLGLYDGGRNPQFFWNYGGKPFLGVFAYGGGIAVLLGAAVGALIREFIRVWFRR